MKIKINEIEINNKENNKNKEIKERFLWSNISKRNKINLSLSLSPNKKKEEKEEKEKEKEEKEEKEENKRRKYKEKEYEIKEDQRPFKIIRRNDDFDENTQNNNNCNNKEENEENDLMMLTPIMNSSSDPNPNSHHSPFNHNNHLSLPSSPSLPTQSETLKCEESIPDISRLKYEIIKISSNSSKSCPSSLSIIPTENLESTSSIIPNQQHQKENKEDNKEEDKQQQQQQQQQQEQQFIQTIQSSPPTKSLGCWSFNTRKRKRVYISLTGKKLIGGAAMRQAQKDKLNIGHPWRVVRNELRESMYNHPQSRLPSELKTLSSWGFPQSVVRKYNSKGVVSLFPWQIECLLIDNAAPLEGRSLLYTAPTSGGKTLVSEILMLRRLGLKTPELKIVKSNQNNVNNETPSLNNEFDEAELFLNEIDYFDEMTDMNNVKTNNQTENTTANTNQNQEEVIVNLDEVERGHGTILFVVPFISLAEEKAAYLQEMWEDLFIGIRTYHGEDDGSILTDDIDIAVCTIEKANSIFNQLLDLKQEHRIHMIVVDELHLISDDRRGFLLEVLLSKVLYTIGSTVQIVAMSATLPNISDLSKWMNASLYTTQYRPVNLEVKVSFGKKLYKVESDNNSSPQLVFDRNIQQLILNNSSTTTTPSTTIIPSTSKLSSSSSSSSSITTLPLSNITTNITNSLNNSHISQQIKDNENKNVIVGDEDGFLSLCGETLREEKSLMVFCSSKKRCESCVSRITDVIQNGFNHEKLSSSSLNNLHQPSFRQTNRMILQEKRLSLINQLKQTSVGLCPLLRRTIFYGVAYHHAGLTVEERKIIEEGFRKGEIIVLCTTSTLSAGVNLPAHRVIIRSPLMGNVELSVASFRQMCGRAGRMGLDAEGEAILMITESTKFKNLAISLVSSPLDPLQSSLQIGSGGGIEKLLLELIYCHRIKIKEDIERFVICTLMSVQHSPDLVRSWVASAYVFLVQHKFLTESPLDTIPSYQQIITSKTSNDELFLRATPLGRATALSGIPPRDALIVLSSLVQARQRLILQSGFHAVYLVTPPSPNIEPCWENYERLLNGLLSEYPDVQLVCNLLGVQRGDLISFQQRPPKYGCTKPLTCFYRRFHAAILLFNLIQEVPLNKVCNIVNLQRGQLQQLQKESSTFCGMISSFCSKLNWKSLACVLESYSSRLNYGVRAELIPLTRLGAEMPGFRARAFYRSGIKTPEDILNSDPELLCSILVDSIPYEGKDPLLASSRIEMREEINENHGLQSKKESCRRLTERIIKKAQKAIEEELISKTREQNFLY